MKWTVQCKGRSLPLFKVLQRPQQITHTYSGTRALGNNWLSEEAVIPAQPGTLAAYAGPMPFLVVPMVDLLLAFSSSNSPSTSWWKPNTAWREGPAHSMTHPPWSLTEVCPIRDEEAIPPSRQSLPLILPDLRKQLREVHHDTVAWQHTGERSQNTGIASSGTYQ